jgi:NDP-sugar pyrophosphorylase family protein
MSIAELENIFYVDRDLSKALITKEKLEERERKINSYGLKRKLKNKKNGKIIETIGELKTYLKTLDDIKKLEDYLEEDDYIYLYKWMQRK